MEKKAIGFQKPPLISLSQLCAQCSIGGVYVKGGVGERRGVMQEGSAGQSFLGGGESDSLTGRPRKFFLLVVWASEEGMQGREYARQSRNEPPVVVKHTQISL